LQKNKLLSIEEEKCYINGWYLLAISHERDISFPEEEKRKLKIKPCKLDLIRSQDSNWVDLIESNKIHGI
jgi:hypothetical protein